MRDAQIDKFKDQGQDISGIDQMLNEIDKKHVDILRLEKEKENLEKQGSIEHNSVQTSAENT